MSQKHRLWETVCSYSYFDLADPKNFNRIAGDYKFPLRLGIISHYKPGKQFPYGVTWFKDPDDPKSDIDLQYYNEQGIGGMIVQTKLFARQLDQYREEHRDAESEED